MDIYSSLENLYGNTDAWGSEVMNIMEIQESKVVMEKWVSYFDPLSYFYHLSYFDQLSYFDHSP